MDLGNHAALLGRRVFGLLFARCMMVGGSAHCYRIEVESAVAVDVKIVVKIGHI